ncbi:MAG: hypothetical protein KC464_31360, partial [Myxococcales bacterium]|nr:hypothetical protein [Myxococcales bacterium]
VSPDGTRAVAVSGDDVVLLGLDGRDPPTTLWRATFHPGGLAWSPDGDHVLVLGPPTDQGLRQLRLLDVAHPAAAPEELIRPVWAFATFTGPREIVTALLPQRQLSFVSLDGDVPGRTCAIPGDYQWLSGVTVAGDDLLVRLTREDGTTTIVRTDRACTTPTTLVDHVALESFAVDPRRRVLGLVERDGDWLTLTEVSIDDATERTTRRLASDVGAAVGFRADGAVIGKAIDTSWRLVERDGDRTVRVIAQATSPVAFVVAPDAEHVALLDVDARTVRLTTLDHLRDPGPVLADDVLDAAWSPDGATLALRRGNGDAAELRLIPIAGDGATTVLPLPGASPAGQLAWLDDDRLAYLRADNQTFITIDRAGAVGAPILDPTRGWAFGLTRARDGALAWMWNRDRRGVWWSPPGGAPQLVVPVGIDENFPGLAWSRDGRWLWMWHLSGHVERWDRQTSRREPITDVEGELGGYVAELVPLDDRRALIQLSRQTVDVAVAEPVR